MISYSEGLGFQPEVCVHPNHTKPVLLKLSIEHQVGNSGTYLFTITSRMLIYTDVFLFCGHQESIKVGIVASRADLFPKMYVYLF